MTRLDPLTQSVTASNPTVPARATQAPADSIPPTEAVSRFVAAVDRSAEMSMLEAGYAAVRVQRRMGGQMAGLSDLDQRLSGAAQGLHLPQAGQAAADGDARAAANEARLAELRGAASALSVAIGGARADVAAVLRQMQAELVAAMEALSNGSEAGASTAEGAVAGTSGSGEMLIRQAAAVSTRADQV